MSVIIIKSVKVLCPTAINIIIAQRVFGKNRWSTTLALGPEVPKEERLKKMKPYLFKPQYLCL